MHFRGKATKPSLGKPRRFENGKIHSLDGWRAISVAGVLIAHWGLGFVHDGWRVLAGSGGVKFFFVISGFLITWLLLREFQTSGKISLSAFYVRRAYRILPVYFAFLLTAALLGQFSTSQLSLRQWLGALFFAANYVDLPVHFGHLWTLAVEEQFYLLWPVVFALASNSYSHGAAVRILVATCFVAPICRAGSFFMGENAPLPLGRFSFFLHVDAIAIGCLAAILFWHSPGAWEWVACHRRKLFLVSTALILLSSPMLGGFHGAIFFKHVLGSSAQATGFVLLLMLSLATDSGWLHRFLNHPMIAGIGVLSYSIYIWHLMFAPDHSGFGFLKTIPALPLWSTYLPLSFVAAMMSYHLLEKPFMALRKRHLTHS